MSSRWPLLNVYRVHSISALVDRCIQELCGLPLEKQFATRGVVTLFLIPTLDGSHVEWHGNGKLLAYIDTQEPLSPLNLSYIAARELSLTYRIDVRIAEKYHQHPQFEQEFEQFSKLFIHRWTDGRNRWTVDEFIARYCNEHEQAKYAIRLMPVN